MQVIPHLTLAALQALPFFVTAVIVTILLWNPLLAYLEEREGAMAGARREAERLSGEIETRMADLAERLLGAKTEVAAVRAAARVSAQKEEATIIAAARSEADEKVAMAVFRIGESKNAASASLKTMSVTLSSDIASQVLGREVSA